MSWDVDLLSGWRSAGGRPVEHLGPVIEGTERRVEIGDSGLWTFVFDRQIAEPLLQGRDILGITRRDVDDYHEARVMARRVAVLTVDGAESERLVVTARSRIFDLTDADLVREFVAGRWVYSFDVTLTPRAILQRFFFTNTTADGLAGVVLGEAPDDVPLRFTWTRWTRGQLLDAVLKACFGEVRWWRQVLGAEQLDVLQDLGADAEVVPLHFGDRLLSLEQSEDWQDCASAYRLAGEAGADGAERASFAENAWRVHAVSAPSGGQVAVTLREIAGTRHPILEDGIFAAHPALGVTACYVQRADGLTRSQVLSSSAAGGTVTLNAATAPVVDEIVTLVDNPDGDPIELLVLPVSAAAQNGIVVADQQVPGMRAERQYLANGGHENGVTDWAAVNGGAFAETTRTELGREIVFTADGTRAPGTGTGTPFTVDGLTPGDRLLKAALIEHVGWESAIDAQAVASALGVLVVDLVTPTPANYADGAAITLRRQDRVTASVEIATPRGANRLFINTGDADIAQRLAAFAKCDQYGGAFTPGDVRVVGPLGVAFDTNWYGMWVHDDDPEVLVVRCGAVGGAVPTPVAATNLQVLSAHRVRVWVPDHTITGDVSVPFVWIGGGSNLPDWLYAAGGGTVLDLLGTIVAGGTFGSLSYVDIDVLGLPSATDLTGLTGYVANLGTGQNLYHFPPSVAWSGTFAITWLRDTRLLELDGPHAMGSTTLTFRAIAALARRDWQNTDTFHVLGHSYTVTGAGAWAADGTASVPVAIPGGVTLRAGTKVWSNFAGTGVADAIMCVVNDVVGPAASVLVRGSDRYPSSWDGVSTPAVVAYLVTETAIVDVPGNVLEVAVTAVANGSGQASVTLTAANAATIADNAVLRTRYAVMTAPTDRQNGSYLRLLCPPDGSGEPNSSTPGVASALRYFRCPVHSTRAITVVSKFRLSMADWFAGQGPAVAIVDAAGTILNWAALDPDGLIVDTEALTVTLSAQAIISASGMYGIRLYGGSVDRTLWCVHDESMFYLGDARDAPYTRGSYPSEGFLRCARLFRERSVPRVSDTLQIDELGAMYERATGDRTGIPLITIGGRARIEERNRLARFVSWTERPGKPLSDVVIGQVLRDGARLLGDAALATNTRGVR